MPICKECGKKFPDRIFDGKKKIDIHNRKVCLECLPRGQQKYPIKYTKEILQKLVESCDSMASVMKKLGLSYISGGMHAHLKKRIKIYGINCSHWNGLGANRGKFIPRRDYKSVLCLKTGIYKESTNTLLRALLQSGMAYKCRCCGLSEWNGKFIR